MSLKLKLNGFGKHTILSFHFLNSFQNGSETMATYNLYHKIGKGNVGNWTDLENRIFFPLQKG